MPDQGFPFSLKLCQIGGRKNFDEIEHSNSPKKAWSLIPVPLAARRAEQAADVGYLSGKEHNVVNLQ